VAGVLGGELGAEFDDGNFGAGVAEGFLGGGGGGEAGADEQGVEMRDAHQDESVAQAAAGVDVVSGVAQGFAEIGGHVRAALKAKQAAASWSGGRGLGGSFVKRGHGVVFGVVRLEQLVQMGQCQDLADVFGNITELEVAARLAGAGEGADHGAEAAAVNENHVAEMEDDGAAVAQQPGDVSAEGFDFAAGDNASLAADDGDPAYLACLQQ